MERRNQTHPFRLLAPDAADTSRAKIAIKGSRMDGWKREFRAFFARRYRADSAKFRFHSSIFSRMRLTWWLVNYNIGEGRIYSWFSCRIHDRGKVWLFYLKEVWFYFFFLIRFSRRKLNFILLISSRFHLWRMVFVII